MGSRWARVARGLLASGVAIFVAALFHVAGGGGAPGAVPIVLSLAFATLASIALTGRRLSLWRLTVSVTLSQFLFHLLFSLGGGSATFSAVDGGGMVHLHPGSHLLMAVGDATHAGMGALPTNAAMWVGHASAVLVTVIALRFGERAFWGLFDSTRFAIDSGFALLSKLVVLAPVTLAFPPARAVESEPSRLRDFGIPLGRLRHRGPPLVASAF
ncbi:hypothetical protein [Leifsonia poae]|uniref:hypothetical protein n=1 Tax=Leifsonia poae TaxID=110933 RepID=UPI001CBE7520|nr:hypothetical protein [Leifsonia poae]